MLLGPQTHHSNGVSLRFLQTYTHGGVDNGYGSDHDGCDHCGGNDHCGGDICIIMKCLSRKIFTSYLPELNAGGAKLGHAGAGQLWPSDLDGGDDHGFAIISVVVIIVMVVMIGCGGLEGEGGDKADSNSARSRPFAGFAFCVDTENCLDFSTFST